MSPVPDVTDMPENNHPEEGSIQDEPFPQHVIGQINSDSDEEEAEGEELGHDGLGYVYAQLPQDPEGVALEESVSSDSEEEGTEVQMEGGDGQNIGGGLDPMQASSIPQVQDLPLPDGTDLLWNQPRSESPGHIDQLQIEKVKTAMAGFELPEANHPDWAQNVSDDDWKSLLLNRLHGNKMPDFKAKFK